MDLNTSRPSQLLCGRFFLRRDVPRVVGERKLAASAKGLQHSAEIRLGAETQHPFHPSCVVYPSDARRQPPSPLGIKRHRVWEVASDYACSIAFQRFGVERREGGGGRYNEDVKNNRTGAFESDHMRLRRILIRMPPAQQF